MKRVLIVSLWLASCLMACQATSSSQKLRDAVLHFHDNVRWQRYREASRALPPHRRAAWTTAMTRMGRMIRIDEYDMRPVEIGDSYAIIEVDLAYHRHDDMRVKREKRQQMWRLVDGAWILESDTEITLDDRGLPERFPELSAPRRHP